MFDEAELKLHRRIVRELEDNVNNRDWWVWIDFDLDDGTDRVLAGLASEVETWLGTMDPDLPIAGAYSLTWGDGSGLSVDLRASPRGKVFRGGPPLVGNPLPVVAFWT